MPPANAAPGASTEPSTEDSNQRRWRRWKPSTSTVPLAVYAQAI